MNHLAAVRVCALLCAAAFLSGPAFSQDGADLSDLVVRMNRLEGQVRQLSGQIEQLQFDNRQLKEQARKFGEDVEFRFNERGARPSTPATTSSPAPARRSDAFDPAANPAAPGQPRALGSATPPATSPATPAPAAREGGRSIAGLIDGNAPATAPAATPPSAAVQGLNPAVAGRSASPAAPAGDDAKREYDAAYALVQQKQYDQAEAGLRRFIQSHPRDRLAADATFWLGESFLQRNRPREAAEQFLKISTEYGRSAKAPDAMLKLGISLGAIGARDQACATFAELGRKYPQASASLKQGVERESRKARCAA